MSLLIRTRSASIVLLLAMLAGCGGSGATPADADTARSALQTALEAWKNDSLERLARAAQPIIFNDHDVRAGRMLLDYKIHSDDRFGNAVRCPVVLSLRDKQGRTFEKRISYLVDTSPKIVIVREDLGS
jgi:hypothetical protein